MQNGGFISAQLQAWEEEECYGQTACKSQFHNSVDTSVLQLTSTF